jgi:hypothetical protein
MVRFLFLFVWAITNLAPQLSAQTTDSLDYFIPKRDPIITTVNGRARFAVSEEVLVRAADLRVIKLGDIESIQKKEINGKMYLWIECRIKDNLQESAIAIVKLRNDDLGNYYADDYWNACIGDSCGSCTFDENLGCLCMTDKPGEPGEPGLCYHVWSDEPLFKTTLIKVRF